MTDKKFSKSWRTLTNRLSKKEASKPPRPLQLEMNMARVARVNVDLSEATSAWRKSYNERNP